MLTAAWLKDLGVRVDRDRELPVGLQLTWALRAAIRLGRLAAGEQLPAARELADALELNVNTVRSVLNRMAQDGDLEVHHGRGTFVAERAAARPELEEALQTALLATRELGVRPQELGSALLAGATDGGAAAATAAEEPASAAPAMERARLRRQIATLEQLAVELDLPRVADATARPRGAGAARLLSLDELRAQRDALLSRLTPPVPDDAPVEQRVPRPARAPQRAPRVAPAT